MRLRILEHILSIIFVGGALFALLTFFQNQNKASQLKANEKISDYLHLPIMHNNDQFHRTLFKDALSIYNSGKEEINQALIRDLYAHKNKQLSQHFIAHITMNIESHLYNHESGNQE